VKQVDTLVIDIGTGATKVESFDSQGGVLQRSVSEYHGVDPKSDEIDPDVWYDAVVNAIQVLREDSEVVLDELRYVVLSGQMQDVIVVKDGRAVTPAILYFGHRDSVDYARWLERFGPERLRERTKNNPDTAGFPAKFLSLSVAKPFLPEDAQFFLCGAHDYVSYRLTGIAATDPTTASTTGLFDPVDGAWATEILDSLGAWKDLAPAVHQANTIDGTILPDVAAALGVPKTTRVLHGAGDVGSSVLAMELEGFSSSIYLGTSGWIQDVADLDAPGDPASGVYNLRHPRDAKIIRVAPLMTAAGAFDWFVDQLLGAEQTDRDRLFSELAAGAAGMGPTSATTIFLPYLAGERSPFYDPDATGMFLGLRKGTDRAELFRAVQEGIAFSIRSIFEVLRPAGALQVTGGGIRVEGFPQLIADVLGREISVADNARFSGTTALRALTGTQVSTNDAAYRQIVPGEERASYTEKYELFRQAYYVNKELMAALRNIS
jgi:xylulokinase